MLNLASPLQSLSNPILDLQNISNEVCDTKRNDSPRQVAIDKLFPDIKKREFDTPLVKSISKEIILEYVGLFSNDRESSINHEANGQNIPQ
jgi:hypothetical protein